MPPERQKSEEKEGQRKPVSTRFKVGNSPGMIPVWCQSLVRVTSKVYHKNRTIRGLI